ncbi:MAG TPA: 3-hydroxyacyl-CoA dehydrogenase family protein [Solirubrobacteraceae bacterium]|nr:3-hydroxyacyl-CoA dehydrogenase family protein [Solirubrobacteraceae bacterium]
MSTDLAGVAVAVIGAGTMGPQIALQAAVHGHRARLFDADPAASARALALIRAELDRRVQCGAATGAARDAALERIRAPGDLAGACADAHLAIEAATERLEVKRAIFARLDRVCPPEAILATNSSSLRVALLEDVTGRPERVINMHFANPVWERPLVELMGGSATSRATLDWAQRFATSLGLLALTVRRPSTGLVFNRVWRAIKRECLHLVEEGVASIEDVDRAWMTIYGGRSGPFGAMDQVGLDVVLEIERVYHAESGLERDRPPRLLADMVARGDLGVKTGRGFYAYPRPAYEDPAFLRPGDRNAGDRPNTFEEGGDGEARHLSETG